DDGGGLGGLARFVALVVRQGGGNGADTAEEEDRAADGGGDDPPGTGGLGGRLLRRRRSRVRAHGYFLPVGGASGDASTHTGHHHRRRYTKLSASHVLITRVIRASPCLRCGGDLASSQRPSVGRGATVTPGDNLPRLIS